VPRRLKQAYLVSAERARSLNTAQRQPDNTRSQRAQEMRRRGGAKLTKSMLKGVEIMIIIYYVVMDVLGCCTLHESD
jgi:predicted anti-sigma-YlaC factor YlaD